MIEKKVFLKYMVLIIALTISSGCSVDNPMRIKSNQCRIPGELIAFLKHGLSGDELEYFLMSFSKFELDIILHDKLRNRIHISFNPKIINEHVFLEMVRNHQYVEWANFFTHCYIFPDWEQGSIVLQMYEYICNDEIEDFFFLFAEYEFSLFRFPQNVFIFKFDHIVIDEFDLLEKFKKDQRIKWVELVPIATVG